MPTIEILQLGRLPLWDQEPLEEKYRIHCHQEEPDAETREQLRARPIRGIVTRFEYGASRALISALPHLEIVANYGVGVDTVDLAACRERNIHVTNTPDVLTDDVADHGIAMMLAQSRMMVAADAWVRTGAWAEKGNFPLTRRVHGKRAGIFGFGRIGRAIADRLCGFGMDIAYCSRMPNATARHLTYIGDPVALARHADFLFVSLAATAETQKIVNRPVIDAVGANGVIINVARGSIIDEPALLDALETGRLGGAALDVFANEPTPDPRFAKLDTVLLQPHAASATIETRKAMGQLMRNNLDAHFEGRDLLTPVA